MFNISFRPDLLWRRRLRGSSSDDAPEHTPAPEPGTDEDTRDNAPTEEPSETPVVEPPTTQTQEGTTRYPKRARKPPDMYEPTNVNIEHVSILNCAR